MAVDNAAVASDDAAHANANVKDAKGTTEGSAPELKTASGSHVDSHLTDSGHPVVMGFGKLGIIRQMALVVSFAAIVALAVAIVIWSQETPYKPLMSSLKGYNASDILSALDRAAIDYRINPTTGLLSVPQDSLHEARMALVGTVLTEDATVGLKLINKEQGLGTSQFIENARYKRDLEGELARIISSLTAVRAARVHLALPKQSLFVRDTREPRASVFLEIYSGKSLDRDQANAIMNLVSSSISNLKIENVTLVDQRGNLLSREKLTAENLLATKQFEYAKKVEDNIMQRLSRLLESLIGINYFKAEVTAEIDFTEVEQTEELFNPDLIALRSEQTLSQEHVLKPEDGVPGALSNQPPGAAQVPEQVLDPQTGQSLKPTERKSEATRNFEVDRTLSYTKHPVSCIQRLTVAVAVNDKKILNAETGESTQSAWNEKELKRLELLVKDTVGFSAARGDSVSVINSTFLGSPQAIEEPLFWAQPWFWDAVKQLLGGIFILMLIFGIIRPVVRSLIVRGQEKDGLDMQKLGGADDLFGDDRVTLAGDNYLLSGASEGYERQLDALKGLIAEDPAHVAQVVKRWINES